ncbi:MAG: CxxxxCH/CxxCH domain-containing protein [Myxococcota bacterium]
MAPLLTSCAWFEPELVDGDPIPFPTSTNTALPPDGFLEGQFCSVRSLLQIACTTGCHSAVVAGGGLDLETDPFYAMVYQPSVGAPGQTLVVPRSLEQSYLYQKVLASPPPLQGGVMPPGGALDPYYVEPLKQWILAGAPYDCAPVDFGTVTQTDVPHHPPGWSDSGVHGLAAKLQTDGDCRGCHGQYLDGETNGVSCDTCHTAEGYPDWRTNCTFCHGGTVDASGAPPKDIDGQENPDLISFTAHSTHIDGDDHYAYGCTQCHDKPTDVLTPGHIFDDVTPGYGELDYTAGYSPVATYYQKTCSNVYCHGDGYNVLGTVADGEGPLACYDCHADLTTPQYWNVMSGHHEEHLQQGDITCYDCHQSVVDAAQYVIAPQYHVNGQAEVLAPSAPWKGATCTGECHGEDHDNRAW